MPSTKGVGGAADCVLLLLSTGRRISPGG